MNDLAVRAVAIYLAHRIIEALGETGKKGLVRVYHDPGIKAGKRPGNLEGPVGTAIIDYNVDPVFIGLSPNALDTLGKIALSV